MFVVVVVVEDPRSSEANASIGGGGGCDVAGEVGEAKKSFDIEEEEPFILPVDEVESAGVAPKSPKRSSRGFEETFLEEGGAKRSAEAEESFPPPERLLPSASSSSSSKSSNCDEKVVPLSVAK